MQLRRSLKSLGQRLADVEGLLVIDKPVGLTSFQVVARVRRITGVRRVGHAGTLDPFASGVLVVAVGRPFTRIIDQIQAQTKAYSVRMVLGILTDTLDPEGPITAVDEALSTNNAVQQFINNAKFQRTLLDRFCGEIDQVAPRFSAKKKNGIPMYQLARANEEFEIAPSRVRIDSIEVMAIHQTEWPAIDLQVVCGKGTYIRSLVRDIAEALGTIGYAQLLVRDAIGNFTLDSAVVLDDVSPTHLNRAFSI